jgi:uncharacterized protein (UPF0335 family)
MTNGVNAGELKAYIDRIENMETEKREVGEGIKEIYQEAKSTGYDPRIMRKIVSARRKAEQARREEAEIMSLYLDALGMQGELAL